ncbi:hypothetical protein OROGR_001597 [Orobanche gracilis]
MKKGFRNFCNGESSTSTLDKKEQNSHQEQNPLSNLLFPSREPSLEEMFSKLGSSGFQQHRRSCFNGSDYILRRATNPLINQYHRFSLDGKQAMYQSSFTTMDPMRAAGKSLFHYDVESEKAPRSLLPACMIGGQETVIWCKPGVVPKLMGLDAMPIPLKSFSSRTTRESLNAIIRKKNLRKRVERYEKERRELMVDKRGSEVVASLTRTGYTYINQAYGLGNSQW